MKTEKLVVLCFIILLIQLVACERGKMDNESPAPQSARTAADSAEGPGDGNPYIVTEKITGIKLKEPTTFTLVDGKSPFVMWRVVPANIIINGGAQGTIYFQQPGKHRVFAIDSLSYDTTYIDVEVDNEIYVQPNYDQSIQDGDQIYLTPNVYKDSANYLEFNIVTQKEYECSNNRLAVGQGHQNNLYTLEVHGVDVGAKCLPGKTVAKTRLGVAYDLVENYTGNIEIQFQNKTYKGSFKKTGKQYEFTWPYDSGIIFTTKSL